MSLESRITGYLQAGGLFNPESMEHDKVRDLLIDCREALAAPQPTDPPATPGDEIIKMKSSSLTAVLDRRREIYDAVVALKGKFYLPPAALILDYEILNEHCKRLEAERAALIEKLERLATFWESEGKRCYDMAHERGRAEPDRSIMAQSVRFWECARELRVALRSTPASTGAKG